MVQLPCSTTWQIYSVQVLLCGIIRFSDTARQRFALSGSERLRDCEALVLSPSGLQESSEMDCAEARRIVCGCLTEMDESGLDQ